MRRWLTALIVSLGAMPLAGVPDPAQAVASMRAGVAARPMAPRPSSARDRGLVRARAGDGSGHDGSDRDGGRRFGGVGYGDDLGDDLGYGLAGGYVGAAGAPGADGSSPYGAPPPGAFPRGPFPGFRPPAPAPCVRPQIITIGRGVRGADKVRVVYGAPPPPCNP